MVCSGSFHGLERSCAVLYWPGTPLRLAKLARCAAITIRCTTCPRILQGIGEGEQLEPCCCCCLQDPTDRGKARQAEGLQAPAQLRVDRACRRTVDLAGSPKVFAPVDRRPATDPKMRARAGPLQVLAASPQFYDGGTGRRSVHWLDGQRDVGMDGHSPTRGADCNAWSWR